MSLPNKYLYTPLDHSLQIRLLRLNAGQDIDDIQIDIFNANLGHPVYEALSYTWGSSNVGCLILCDKAGDTLSVTQNCEAALRRLRYRDKERTLWIDAICIDQTNLMERSQQVQLMSQIYQKASKVVAYLGEASNNSDIGMDFIQQDSEPMTPNGRPSVDLGPDKESSPQQLAIDNILERPYFERCWILQEIVFAQKILVVLGDRMVDWDSFLSTVFYVDINKKMHLGSKYCKRPPSVVFYRGKPRSLASGKTVSDMPRSLLEFLRDTRHCKATDPRDKVFALLAMSTEKDEPALAPNYFLTAQQTFAHLTKHLISRDGVLDVLCHVQGPPCLQNLPTWVPDWSCYSGVEIIGHKKDSVRPYKASMGRTSKILFEPSIEAMSVEGKVFDTISKVGPVYEFTANSSATTLRRWESIVSDVQSDHGSDASKVFMDTLIAYPPYKGPNAFGIFYQSWYRLAVFEESLVGRERSEATIFQDQVNKASNGRALFVTQKGYVGLGPAHIKLGESVAILSGGPVPFILQDQGIYFSFVGECYVHGLMNGEAIEDDTVDFQIISIR